LVAPVIKRLPGGEPASEQHPVADGYESVVLDVAVTTGAVHDILPGDAQLEAITAISGAAPQIGSTR
jgi:hypothetical protein